MPEFLAAVVGRKTILNDELYLRHAAHQSMTVYLEDWEQAYRHLGRAIEALRVARDQRKSDTEAGRWPLASAESARPSDGLGQEGAVMPDTEIDRRFSGRGFRIFHTRRREPDERLYGEDVEVKVVESSLATRGPHVRIYEGSECVQLNMAEAEEVRNALETFLHEAGQGLLTEPPPSTEEA